MLARRLPGISGRFMPSVKDVAQMRAIFARFAIEAVSTRYTVCPANEPMLPSYLVTGPAAEPLSAVREHLTL